MTSKKMLEYLKAELKDYERLIELTMKTPIDVEEYRIDALKDYRSKRELIEELIFTIEEYDSDKDTKDYVDGLINRRRNYDIWKSIRIIKTRKESKKM